MNAEPKYKKITFDRIECMNEDFIIFKLGEKDRMVPYHAFEDEDVLGEFEEEDENVTVSISEMTTLTREVFSD